MKVDHDKRVIRLRDQIQAETDREKLEQLVNELMQAIGQFEKQDSRRAKR